MADMVPAKRPAEADSSEDMEAKRRKQANADRLAAIKARVATKKTALQSATENATPQSVPVQVASPTVPGAGASPSAAPEDERAKSARRLAEVMARLQAQKAQGGAASTSRPALDIQAQIAEATAKAQKLAQQNETTTSIEDDKIQQNRREITTGELQYTKQYETSNQANRGSLRGEFHPALRDDFGTNNSGQRTLEQGGRGGLSVGLHPSLLQNSLRQTGTQQSSRYGTSKGARPAPKSNANPYLPDEEETKDSQGRIRERKSKALSFFEHGKFIAQGNAQREAAELEEMKRRIAFDARKTEIEEASDRAFVVPRPPPIEWWDQAALPDDQSSYDGINLSELLQSATLSNVTDLVCHPVLLQPPQEKFQQSMKPLMLTTKETKKLRRQRRAADMKEVQARIRMGLMEPPPPKVKKSNMMRVLGEQAVKDPTAVEARVNREIAQRQYDHERANEERALTKEQRHEKLNKQQADDQAKGLWIAVFKVDDLSSGKHRYLVDVNAKHHALTGVVVMNPTMYLIIVEGGLHSMKQYKKELRRIKWTENSEPPAGSNPTTFTGTRSEDASGLKGRGSKAAEWCNPWNDDGTLKDLSANRCVLVWEGAETELKYKKWEPRTCETDGEARDFLKRSGMENMWTLARSK